MTEKKQPETFGEAVIDSLQDFIKSKDADLRRCRVYLIDPQDVMILLGNWRHYEYAALPRFDLPEGFRIANVSFDWMTNMFAVAVYHESFDAVQPGERFPDFGILEQRREVFRVPLEAPQ
jgi:hypothetical protein